jgi:hypothetical protein
MMQHSRNYADIFTSIYKNNKNSGDVNRLQKFTLVNSRSTSQTVSTGTLIVLDASYRVPDDGFFAVIKRKEKNLDLQPVCNAKL